MARKGKRLNHYGQAYRSFDKIGAGGGTRTRDPDLGKVVLYQLSYTRVLFEQGQI
jgi:hypothetical protein